MYDIINGSGPYTPDGHATMFLRAANRNVATFSATAAAMNAQTTGAYNPLSFTVATESYALVGRHLKLTSSARATLQGTSCLRIT